MTFIVRRARESEGKILGLLGFRAWETSIFAELDAGRVDRTKLRNEFVDFCTKSYAATRVAEEDGRILGWGAREEADYVSDLWVTAASRGRGVGSLLLGALEEDVRKAGLPTVNLETHAANEPATQFYLKHGYAIVWRGEKFSTSLGYAIDKLRFCKDLGTKTTSA